jgi:hypothetical protein
MTPPVIFIISLNTCFKSDKGQYSSIIRSEIQSKLFTMFMQGCKKRMGRLVNQNLGLSLDMLKIILNNYEDELVSTVLSRERKWFIIMCSATFVVLLLRGGEVFMMEALKLVKQRDDGRRDRDNGHVVIPLMGRFKNETGERKLVFVLANETSGGLKSRKWTDKLTKLLKEEGKGRTTGPAICDVDGYVLERWKINGELHNMLAHGQVL